MKVLEMAGGDNIFLPYIKSGSTIDERKTMKDRVTAMWFLLHSDRIRFGALIGRMRESQTLGKNIFPSSIVKTYDILIRTEKEADGDRKRREGNNNGNNRGIQFMQQGRGGGRGGRGHSSDHGGRGGRGRGGGRYIPDGAAIIRGNDGRVHNIQCRICNEYGHFADQCPSVPVEGNSSDILSPQRSSITSAYLFSQIDNFELTNSIRLLDTCASHSSTNLRSTCRSIRKCLNDEILYAETNGGSTIFDQVGELNLLPLQCYYNENTLATILAFHEVVALDDVEIKYDSTQENAFFLFFKSVDRIMKFKQCAVGLYYYDESKPEEHEYKRINFTNSQLNYTFLSSINRTKQLMSRHKIEQADKARRY